MRRAWIGSIVAVALAAMPVHGALPPSFGGEITLPAPAPITELDPTRVESHLEATLCEAVFDGLYERRADGTIVPVLADGLPQIRGNVARIRIRQRLLHQAIRPLVARHVVRSLLRAASAPRSSWLLGAIALEGGRPAIREVDPTTIELTLANPNVRLTRILSSSSLAIVIGGDLRARPIGTGAYRARLDGHGGAELEIFRQAPDAPPWIDRIHWSPPRSRDDELRAFELAQLDGSWWGQSLYGGAPVRPVTSTTAAPIAAVLMIPNRARALRDDALWGAVVRSLERERLERMGIAASRTLGAGLPAPDVPPWQQPPRGLTLNMIVRAADPLEPRLAEAIAGMLDEHGIRLIVEPVPASRYDATLGHGGWDLRLGTVRPPLPDAGALVGAALALVDQSDRARRIAVSIDDADLVQREARSLGVMVLGHERIVLHHRADLLDLRFDPLGRLILADASLGRPAERRVSP